PANDNKIVEVWIATSWAEGDTIDVRCANAAGTAQYGCPFSVDLFYVDASTATDGFMFSQYAVFGATLRSAGLSSSGDRLACLQTAKVRLVNGALSHIPNLGTFVMHINDVSGVHDISQWATDLTTFEGVADDSGPVGFFSPYECNTTTYAGTSG